MGDLFENSRLDPTPSLLINNRPRWKVVWQKAPLATRLHEVTQSIEELAQRIIPLGRIFPHQRQVGEKKPPFHIRDSARIRLPCRVYALTQAEPNDKSITGSVLDAGP